MPAIFTRLQIFNNFWQPQQPPHFDILENKTWVLGTVLLSVLKMWGESGTYLTFSLKNVRPSQQFGSFTIDRFGFFLFKTVYIG